MEAIILAGGLGSRISKRYKSIPKSMIKFDNKPFIYYQLKELQKNKIKNVILCLGHLSKKIEIYVKKNFSDMSIKFSYDGITKLGTGGAIKKACNLLSGKNFILIYGDSYLSYSYQKIIDNYNINNYIAMNVVFKNNNQFEKSNIHLDNKNLIISMADKNFKKKYFYIDWGMSILNKKIFLNYNKKIFELIEIKKNLIIKKKLRSYIVYKRFFEIGSYNGISDFKNFIIKKQYEK